MKRFTSAQQAGGDLVPEREVHPEALLALVGVRKSFGAVHALVDGRLVLRAGEVHALVGENGAGKSTLVKVLAGVHAPDEGVLTLDGEPLVFGGPADARAAGVAVIYQEPTPPRYSRPRPRRARRVVVVNRGG
ncbi:ATP-binding cassette domain-containing protein [Phytohabitans kaempferiae]|uniref:ATP-binding cassette domain-containing protein n=1 Tax=Phytohabitans kaempferiae TaxID=1620943 RepID=A0ABV6MCP3_9ACTN